MQDVSVRVTFTSPSGRTVTKEAFWDGGRTWRVRLAPKEVGRWTFSTACSDPDNTGLHEQVGGFLCTANLGRSAFNQHGALRVKDGGTFAHEDGTPVFLLADDATQGALRSADLDWEVYGNTRALQGFTAVLWSASPGVNHRGESGITGFSDRIKVNPEYFQYLDRRLEALKNTGLTSVIIPYLAEESEPGVKLPEDQLQALFKYMVARWDADPVIWMLPMGSADEVAKWKTIGENVFGRDEHRPVLLKTGTHVDSLKELTWLSGIASEPIKDEAQGPLLALLPQENAPASDTGRIRAEQIQQAAASALVKPGNGGLLYRAWGVADWNTSIGGDTTGLPFWRKSLFLPGAKQVLNMVKSK